MGKMAMVFIFAIAIFLLNVQADDDDSNDPTQYCKGPCTYRVKTCPANTTPIPSWANNGKDLCREGQYQFCCKPEQKNRADPKLNDEDSWTCENSWGECKVQSECKEEVLIGKGCGNKDHICCFRSEYL